MSKIFCNNSCINFMQIDERDAICTCIHQKRKKRIMEFNEFKHEYIKLAAYFFINHIIPITPKHGDPNDIVTAENLSELLLIITNKQITKNAGKIVLNEMIKTKEKAVSIIELLELTKIDAFDTLISICEKIVIEFPVETERYKSGKKNLLGFFVGEAMKQTKNAADPIKLREIFTSILSKG